MSRARNEEEMEFFSTGQTTIHFINKQKSLLLNLSPFANSIYTDFLLLMTRQSTEYFLQKHPDPNIREYIRLGRFSNGKRVFCCCWIRYSINVNRVKWIGTAVPVNYILTDFLPP